MKKVFSLLLCSVVALGLVGCSKESSVDDGGDNAADAGGRLYNGFTLATSYNPEFDPYVNWHSDNIYEFGAQSSTNVQRFENEESDALIEEMLSANSATEEGKAQYQKAYQDWIILMNEEMPILPLYVNDYHDLYNPAVKNFETSSLWQWPEAIVTATGVDTFVAGNTSFSGEFIQGWTNSSYDNNVRKIVYGGTGLYSVLPDGSLSENFMVENVTVSEDQTEWTFKLKEGLKFSTGEDFTANDVAFTYYMFGHPTLAEAGGDLDAVKHIEGYEEYNKSGDPADFTGIEVISDYEIKFTVPEPTFVIKGTVFGVYLLSEAQMAPDGEIDVNTIKAEYMNTPVGLGPYKIVEWRQGEFVKLEINEYFQGDIQGNVPTIQTVIVKVVDSSTELDQLISGEIDLIAGAIEEEKIDGAKEAGLAYSNYPRHGFGHITWHNDFGVTAYPEVRQALAYAIDREAFNENFAGKYTTTVEGPYSTEFWMIDQAWVDENLVKYEQDSDKVVEILEEAGWERGDDGIFAKDGEKLQIRIAAGNPDWVDSLRLVTDKSVEEYGIEFTVESIDFAVLLEHYYGTYKG